MPLPGGASDKFGNRYEAKWTVHCILDVLRERATSILLEPVGDFSPGTDFVLSKDKIKEFHQVKRQRTGSANWSLERLKSDGILQKFFPKLRDNSHECKFVSTYPAVELSELCERAKGANNFEQFEQLCLNGELKSKFSVLVGAWQGCRPEVAFQFLRRTHVETISENFLEEEIQYKPRSRPDN